MAIAYRNKHNQCTNCGEVGHHFRGCTEPIYSYGIIAFRFKDKDFSQEKIISNSNTFTIPDYDYLLIQRRDSIGYVELIRAKYKLSDIQYIQEQISGTTQEERLKLLTKPFEELWVGLWGLSTFETKQYKQEYEQAKYKMEQLRSGIQIDSSIITLKSLIDDIPCIWKTPEWGFPKGRRNVHETDLACATREFCEETGLMPNQFSILENIIPLKEEFCGNNNIRYRHIYYVAWIPSSVQVKYQKKNEHMIREIGDIQWYSPENALQIIRSTNIEKREILQSISKLLLFTVPLLIGPIADHHIKIEQDALNRNGADGNTSTSKSEYTESQSNSKAKSCNTFKGRSFNALEN